VPLEVLRDTIQPFPTFSEIYVAAPKALHGEVTAAQVDVDQTSRALRDTGHQSTAVG
jgi:hypothetical protein